jgi:hypothetical protein
MEGGSECVYSYIYNPLTSYDICHKFHLKFKNMYEGKL